MLNQESAFRTLWIELYTTAFNGKLGYEDCYHQDQRNGIARVGREILSDLVIQSCVHNAIAENEELAVLARNVDVAFVEGEIILTGVIDNHNVGNTLCGEFKSVSGV